MSFTEMGRGWQLAVEKHVLKCSFIYLLESKDSTFVHPLQEATASTAATPVTSQSG